MSRCDDCGWSGSHCDCAEKAKRLRASGVVNLDNLMGLFEAAYTVRLTETRVRQLRREGKFVEPVKHLHCGDLWLKQDLLDWMDTRVKKRAGRPAGPRKGPDVEEGL